MDISADITLEAVVLNNTGFSCGQPLEQYVRILGQPTRSIMVGPPPPFGHRNNVLHYYDDLGLFLREHHKSYLIDGIDILLDPSRSHFPTTSPYTGTLRVFGIDVHVGMPFHALARRSPIQFTPHLGHAWFVDGEQLSIQLEVIPGDDRHPQHKDVVWGIMVGFVGAHIPKQVTDRAGEKGSPSGVFSANGGAVPGDTE